MLPPSVRVPILPEMFVVTDAEAAAIREALQQRGVTELRRLFPGITGTMQARECVRATAGWRLVRAPRNRSEQVSRQAFLRNG
jgi:hypothetical protein